MAESKIGVVIHTDLRRELFSDEDCARLNSLGKVVWTESSGPISNEEAVEMLRDADIGVGSWGTPFPNQMVMDGCPRLRFWEHVAGTVKGMFGPHLDGREMTIVSCKGAIADNVAEMTVGEIVVGLRRVWENALQEKGLLVSDGAAQGEGRRKYPQRRVMSVATVGRGAQKLQEPFIGPALRRHGRASRHPLRGPGPHQPLTRAAAIGRARVAYQHDHGCRSQRAAVLPGGEQRCCLSASRNSDNDRWAAAYRFTVRYGAWLSY